MLRDAAAERAAAGRDALRSLRDAAAGDGILHEADLGGEPRGSREQRAALLRCFASVKDKERQSLEHEEERKRLEQEAL